MSGYLLDTSAWLCAVEVHRLSASMHRDPADRIISATAIVHKLTILTSDGKLLDHPGIPTFDTR